ncbi:MAG: glycosyltransferase [Candidatus Cloacimonetes bacterium]|nr:glycosyltransferase [Candidatus Cloacimonadota bacterium]
MTWIILITIAICGSLLYYYYLALSWGGYGRKRIELIAGREYVSVIVAARNEAENIRELLVRLGNQNYPAEFFEVIIADDGSEDGTGEIAEEYAVNWDNLKVLHIRRESGNQGGKKNALQQAVESASGELILITDADCLPGSNWIRTMVSGFDNDIDMVAGLSRTKTDTKLQVGSVQWFEHFDFMAMFAVTGGLILGGKYFSCSAQNLAYRKSSWEKVGGYSRIMHLVSGDDVNLMQLFRQAGMKITFSRTPASFMTTSAVGSWRELLNQRSRWASNTGVQLSANPEFFAYLMSALIITYFPWIVLAFNFQIGFCLLFVRLVVEMKFVKTAFGHLQAEKNLWLSYPLWMIMQPIYMLFVAVGGFFSLYSWKK